ncbi:MAG: hypothetical protein OEY56_06810, partial [Cyclobacteriaceae bacterium]|nr:hypothetical protein [Cyclobacteriaceae bacterium]
NLTAFLRAELKNDFIRMSHEVKEGETVKKLYTSSDKYDYMVTQNPQLKELKEQLGLDFEY